jgi:hypothetical protein
MLVLLSRSPAPAHARNGEVRRRDALVVNGFAQHDLVNGEARARRSSECNAQ